jgi:hypothetical protein
VIPQWPLSHDPVHPSTRQIRAAPLGADAAVANPTLMRGHVDADIAVGRGACQASGEWRAIKVRD